MALSVCQGFLLALNLLAVCQVQVSGQTESSSSGNGMLLPFTEDPEGSGSGFGTEPPLEGSGGSGMDVMLITCSNPVSQLTVSFFQTFASAVDSFGCDLTASANSTGLLFIVELPDGSVLALTEQISSMLFIDSFQAGQVTISVTVCTSKSIGSLEECDGEDEFDLGTVLVNITSHEGRLFPYGESLNDSSYRGVLDGAVVILPPQSVPFYSTYYDMLYVSTNGLMSLDQPYLSWWPVPFPFGRTLTPVIAPYWTDLDFRNPNVDTSKVYYNKYSTGDGSARSDELLELFADRLDTYADADVDFEPEWMVVATWSEGTPYYWRFNTDRTLTFQLVLATDYISTYAFYLYPSGGLSDNLPSWQRVVIGHDPKDYTNYHNVELLGTTRLSSVDDAIGNTGLTGQWYFNFTSPDSEADSEQLCLEWDREQRTQNNTFEEYFSGLPSCPCTHLQARRDWRFWFAHFWGLSSRPNCATFLWSRRQATIECCYDTEDGSLLVGPNEGGSYLLYNPLFRFADYFQEDRLPYRYCCENSNRCDLYYTHRPSDNCANYNPPRRFFIFGDPHFKSIDDRNFTFNGIGEYLFLESTANDLTLQGRLEQFDANTPGTVATSIAVKEGDSQPVQVNAESGSFVLYVNGNQTELPGTGSAVIVGNQGVVDINTVNTAGVGMNEEQIFVRREDEDGDESLIITTPAGASISIRMENSFLGISVELSENFRDETRGLLGVFNDNISDDFTLPNGTVLDISDERNIYQFGLEWHLDEADSIFSYGDLNYSSINNGYLDFEPTFFDELNITQEVQDACGNNQACLLDATLTGNIGIGNSTLEVSMENEDLEQVLDNHPPTITNGDFVLFVDTMESISATYQVMDPDGDDIQSLKLKGHESVGITFTQSTTGSEGTLELTWSDPGYTIPTEEIRIVASDTKGASASARISVVLCGCMNNGNCTNTAVKLNSQGHFKRLCSCPLYFGGDSCEIEMRGCGFDDCPDYAVCTDDSSVDAGYVCANCSEGYDVVLTEGDDNKCIDIDECNSTSTNNCEQLCVNTEGSYTCDCMDGYRLATDNVTCEDVDECLEGLDDCDQICDNTDGNFTCSCYAGHTLDPDINECTPVTCTEDPCDLGTTCIELIDSDIQCVCPLGEICTGTCTGDAAVISMATQQCGGCAGGTYGFNCMETCNCMNGGTCESVHGCMCPEGEWTGIDCSIQVNNFKPVFEEGSFILNPIRWNLPASSLVATVVATDNDTNRDSGRVRYLLARSQYQLPSKVADGFDYFSIDPVSGEITNNQNLREVYTNLGDTSFVLDIVARDQGITPQLTRTTLTITPLPVPMLPDSIDVIEVDENTEIKSTVFDQFDCTELGPSSNSLVLTLNSTTPGLFIIDDNLRLAVSGIIDFEDLSNPLLELEVTCSNRHQISDSLKFQVMIENIDDNPFEFDLPEYSVEILENITADEIILTVQAVDLDSPNSGIEYSFVEGFQEFHIHPSTGEIRTTSIGLDRETVNNYTLKVMAILNEPGVNTEYMVTVNVTVILLDVNDNSPYFIESDVYIAETLSGSEIGDLVLTVVAMDDDFGENGEVQFQLETNDNFEINETTGEIFISGQLPPDTLIELAINASDNGDPPLISVGEVIIYVRPSPERLRFDQTRYVFNVTENNSRGNLIGTVQAEILDVLNSTFNESSAHRVGYEIVIGSFESIFTISRQSGAIFLLSSLDYESAPEYDLTVRATLSSDVNITRDVIVQVLVGNINDNAPQFSASFYTQVVEEFTPSGTPILTVTATDIDNIDSANITFSLDITAGSVPFEIDSTTGVLTSSEDLVTLQDYRFNVLASDGELESEAVIFISVTRSSSVTPTFTKEKYIFNISENTQPGSYIGTVEALAFGNMSSEAFPHLGFRNFTPDMPSADNSGSLFHIDQDTGDISTISSTEFDAETQTMFVFYVEVFNVDNSSIVYDSAVIEVQLADENDHRPVFTQSLYTRVINTSQPVDSVILTVSATDGDSTNANSEVAYSIVTGPLGFTLDATTGELSVTNSTLSVGEFYVMVLATDNGEPQMNGTATVFIAISPATPERVEFNQSTYYFTISEMASAGALVGAVQAFDSNRTITSTVESLVYSTPNVTLCFSLDEVDGEIRVSCQLDRESVPRFELEIVATVTDADELVRGFVTVVIDILDINDNSPVFSLDVYATVINDQHGNDSSVLQVSAMDIDTGDNALVVYSLAVAPGSPVFATDYFIIGPSNGNVTLRNPTIPIGDYRLLAVAEDRGEPVMSSTALVLVCVTRAQPAQIIFETVVFKIEENSVSGASVGTIVLSSGIETIVPSEFTGNLEFRIINADQAIFDIDNTGEIITAVASSQLDREEAPSHVIDVVADFVTFGVSTQMSITINVLDVNDEPPIFEPNVYSTVIEDNTDSGEVILNITARDTDFGSNANVSFSISDDLNFPFEVAFIEFDPPFTRGQILVSNISYLIPGAYEFSVLGFDGANYGTGLVSIIVEHALPEVIFFPSPLYTFNLTEHSVVGTFVGNISVVQETPALDGLLYEITGGNMGTFHLDPLTGTLTNALTIDREVNAFYTLTIRAYLPGEPLLAPTNTTINVTILDLNDNRPLFTEGGSYSVSYFADEISTTTSLITVVASDADEGRNSELQFNITAGNDLGLFRIEQTGAIFATTSPLNVSTYMLTVTVEDMGDSVLSDEGTVTITVQNAVPESIAFLQPDGYYFNVSEDLDFNDPIGQVSVETIEPEDLQPHLDFEVTPSTFTIDSNGMIRGTGVFDYEVTQNYTLTVTAILDVPIERFRPKLTLMVSVQVVILVIDLNDNDPVFIDFPFNLEQQEERAEEELITTLVAQDIDSGSNQQLVYELLNTDLSVLNNFRLDPDSGELYAAAGLDREEQGVYSLIIQVCDMGEERNCVEETSTFTLIDINDNTPVLLSGLVYEVPERLPAGTTVFTLRAEDPDLGSFGAAGIRYQLYLVESSTGEFYGGNAVFLETARTGAVRTDRELDYEVESYYMAQLLIRDNQGRNPRNVITPEPIIRINVTDEPDNEPTFTIPNREDLYQVYSDPMLPSDTTIIDILATDADPGDVITYYIMSVSEDGNEGILPLFEIDQNTGRVFLSEDQVFIPQATFTIGIRVYDNSQFNLTADTTLIVNIRPEPLEFEQADYTVSISEGITVGGELTRLTIRELSVSSEISYILGDFEPSGQADLISITGNGGSEAIISLAVGRGLDREDVEQYRMTIIAERTVPDAQTTMTNLVINVQDENDNSPVFGDGSNPVIYVVEELGQGTPITTINVTDRDIDNNARIQYSIIGEPPGFPFLLNRDTGLLTTAGDIDYENVQSFTMTVLAQDSGTRPLSSMQTYTIELININDNHPQFSASAYFGEVYSEAQQGDIVHYVQLSVTDADDFDNAQLLEFEISPRDLNDVSGYSFQVTEDLPYQIEVVSVPEVRPTNPTLLRLEVQVTDSGGLSATVFLYIYIFVPDNLVTINIRGGDQLNLQEFESCVSVSTSLCLFLDVLGDVVTRQQSSSENIFFGNHSLVEKQDNTLDLAVYGWYGSEFNIPRDTNGELSSSTATFNPSIRYFMTPNNPQTITSALGDNRFLQFDFEGEVVEETAEPPTESEGLDTTILIAIAVGSGVVVAVLIVLVIIVIVCVRGRRRDEPRRRRNRRESDPYLRRKEHDRKRRRAKSRRSSVEDLPLTSRGGSDLAYETMYDDDDILDSKQTMPWFDPKYLATDEQYDGDTEKTQPRGHPGNPRGGPVRATVDGNARRQRRYSSDESAAADSANEMETYLDQYQQSQPIQPGQRMGEYDMFARPPDDDRPFRPSLEQYDWKQQQPKQPKK